MKNIKEYTLFLWQLYGFLSHTIATHNLPHNTKELPKIGNSAVACRGFQRHRTSGTGCMTRANSWILMPTIVGLSILIFLLDIQGHHTVRHPQHATATQQLQDKNNKSISFSCFLQQNVDIIILSVIVYIALIVYTYLLFILCKSQFLPVDKLQSIFQSINMYIPIHLYKFCFSLLHIFIKSKISPKI